MLSGFYERIGTAARCKEQASPARVRCHPFSCRSKRIREEALARISRPVAWERE